MESIINFLTNSNITKISSKNKIDLDTSKDFKIEKICEKKNMKMLFIYTVCNMITFLLVLTSSLYFLFINLF